MDPTPTGDTSHIGWNNLADTATNEQLQFLIQSSIHGKEAKELLKTALQKTLYDT
jgi:hypothetical protein